MENHERRYGILSLGTTSQGAQGTRNHLAYIPKCPVLSVHMPTSLLDICARVTGNHLHPSVALMAKVFVPRLWRTTYIPPRPPCFSSFLSLFLISLPTEGDCKLQCSSPTDTDQQRGGATLHSTTELVGGNIANLPTHALPHRSARTRRRGGTPGTQSPSLARPVVTHVGQPVTPGCFLATSPPSQSQPPSPVSPAGIQAGQHLNPGRFLPAPPADHEGHGIWLLSPLVG